MPGLGCGCEALTRQIGNSTDGDNARYIEENRSSITAFREPTLFAQAGAGVGTATIYDPEGDLSALFIDWYVGTEAGHAKTFLHAGHFTTPITISEPTTITKWKGTGPAQIGDPIRLSSSFPYRYEFDTQPNLDDQDNNGTSDFWSGWDIGTIANGVSTMSNTTTDRDGTVATDFGGSIWREHFLVGDWTVELNFRVVDQTLPRGAAAVLLATNSSDQENFWVFLDQNNIRITLPGGSIQTIHTGDNTDQLHTLRVMRKDNRHYLWRDGTLLNSSTNPADGYLWAPNTVGTTGLRTSLGIASRFFSGQLGGTIELDYLRLDPTGAFTAN